MRFFAHFRFAAIAAAVLLATIPQAVATAWIKSETRLDDILPQDALKDAKNGEVIIGDMIFRTGPRFRAAAGGQLWTGGIIVYEFDTGITTTQQQAFINACTAWTVGTALTCRQRTNETDRILVKTHNGEDCNGPNVSCSSVGRIGGQQRLSVYSGHWTIPHVIQHEIGHAIGLIHEHQRPDRDSYIFIIEGNVQAGRMNQFNIWNNVSVGSDYDYTSIMHYDNCAFAISTSCTSTTYDLQTIVPKPCHLDIVGGDPISTLDYDGIRRLYAPALQAVLVNERAPSCGTLEYRPEQFQQVCGPNCKLSPTTDFRKKEEVYQNWCGMMARLPDGYEQSRCVPLKKDYVKSWWDHDEFSCGRLNLETRHELWVQCGCPFVSAASLCTNINAFSVGSYQEKPKWPDWRAGRVVYFNDIVRELSVDKLLQQNILDKLGTFYQKNYLDSRFETKLSRVRAGMYAYARWKRSIDPQYSMPEDFFKKIVSRHRLRWSS